MKVLKVYERGSYSGNNRPAVVGYFKGYMCVGAYAKNVLLTKDINEAAQFDERNEHQRYEMECVKTHYQVSLEGERYFVKEVEIW